MSEETEYKPDYSFGGLYPQWLIQREEAADLSNASDVRARHHRNRKELEKIMKEHWPVEWAHVFGGSSQ